MPNIAVIGGGAAGMMAAVAAAERGGKVTLWEKNEKLGKKLFITGKGRCNVTNAADISDFFMQVRRNAKFLYSAFYGYDNRMLMDFLEKEGLPLKTERGGRVYPASDKSSDVIRVFDRALRRLGVEIRLNAKVDKLLLEDRGEGKTLDGLSVVGKEYPYDGVILATGGASYPRTGSTGDGYSFARQAGHSIVETGPSLIPMDTEESWPGTLAGLSLKNVVLRVVQKGKVCYDELGEMLFTHTGVSGPLVLSGSSYCRGDGDIRLEIDMKPALSPEQLEARLQRDFDKYARKQFANTLGDLLPSRMVDMVVGLSGIPPEIQAAAISKEQRRRLAALLKGLLLTVRGFRPLEEAIVTRGGVDCRGVNASTMESLKTPGLYLAGELLDLDASTGGYNLQIAFSTGHLAGVSAAGRGGG